MKDRLRKLRKTLDLTQSEFAERIGTVQNTITGYESGRRNPSGPVISAICKEFNVNKDWLLNNEGEMFNPSSNDAINELTKKYDLSNTIRLFIEKLVTLNPKDQEVVTNFLISFASNMQALKESGIDFYETPNTVSDSKCTYPEPKDTDMLIKEKLASYEAELRAEFASKESQGASLTGSTGTESHKAI